MKLTPFLDGPLKPLGVDELSVCQEGFLVDFPSFSPVENQNNDKSKYFYGIFHIIQSGKKGIVIKKL